MEAEVKSDEVIGVLDMPGWVISEGVRETHRGEPIPGWFQMDDGVIESDAEDRVTHVKDAPLEPDRMYRVATKIGDLTNGQSPTMTKYYQDHPELLPPKGAYVNIHSALMEFFARNLWRKLWDSFEEGCDNECSVEDLEERLAALDIDGSGDVSVEEIHEALKSVLGLKVDDSEMSLAKFVHSFADVTGDGKVGFKDFEKFCAQREDLYEIERWRLGSPQEKDVVPDHRDRMALVEELLQGRPLDWEDDKGETMLTLMAEAGRSKEVQALIAAGADVNSKSKTLWTALHGAAECGDVRCIELLVLAGAELDAETQSGLSALAIARKYGQAEAEATLRRLGAL